MSHTPLTKQKSDLYFRILVMSFINFMKKLFYHENTKARKHEKNEKLRAFQFSYFRD